MKERGVFGVIFILLGGLIAIGPKTIFKVCNATEKMMKCHWTAQTEFGIGTLISVLGLLILVIAARQIRIGITIGIILNSIITILIPNVLIGVCQSSHMHCHSLTLPALTLLGIVTGTVGIVSIIYLSKKERE